MSYELLMLGMCLFASAAGYAAGYRAGFARRNPVPELPPEPLPEAAPEVTVEPDPYGEPDTLLITIDGVAWSGGGYRPWRRVSDGRYATDVRTIQLLAERHWVYQRSQRSLTR